MSEYKLWRNAKQVRVIKEVSFDVKVRQCLDPFLKDFPSLEVLVNIKQIDIFFSDWVNHTLNKLRDIVNPPPTDEELFNKALIQLKPKFEELKKEKKNESDSDHDDEDKGEAVIGAI